MLPENKMVPYLEGEYTIAQAQADLRAKARPRPTLPYSTLVLCVESRTSHGAPPGGRARHPPGAGQAARQGAAGEHPCALY